jgi:hypothetical protein
MIEEKKQNALICHLLRYDPRFWWRCGRVSMGGDETSYLDQPRDSKVLLTGARNGIFLEREAGTQENEGALLRWAT